MRYLGTLKAVLAVAAMLGANAASAQTSVQVLPGPDNMIRGGARVMPAGDPGRWVTDADYPALARGAHEAGTVGFRLEVDADGTVSDCTVTQTSGSRLLDSTTCALMTRRARFIPARDRDNEPTRAMWGSRISWSLPAEDANAPKS